MMPLRRPRTDGYEPILSHARRGRIQPKSKSRTASRRRLSAEIFVGGAGFGIRQGDLAGRYMLRLPRRVQQRRGNAARRCALCTPQRVNVYHREVHWHAIWRRQFKTRYRSIARRLKPKAGAGGGGGKKEVRTIGPLAIHDLKLHCSEQSQPPEVICSEAETRAFAFLILIIRVAAARHVTLFLR